jgi:hypothetical protein
MAALLWATGCGSGTTAPASSATDGSGETEGGAADASEPKGANEHDSPEISRSVGEKGGVVVLWPRVIPASSDPKMKALAETLQSRLMEVAEAAAPGAALDKRPEPERVCPRSGCAAAALGAVLVHLEGGCVALGLVSDPGPSPTHIVPWAGVVELAKDEVAFREPPESEVKILDAVPCKDLGKALGEQPAKLVEALKAAAER